MTLRRRMFRIVSSLLIMGVLLACLLMALSVPVRMVMRANRFYGVNATLDPGLIFTTTYMIGLALYWAVKINRSALLRFEEDESSASEPR